MSELKWIDPGYLCIAVPGTEMFVDSGIVRRDWEEPLGLLERQVAVAPEMYGLLKELEWSQFVEGGGDTRCPVCHGDAYPVYKHEPDCRLAAVLKAVEGE
jgi:hypothetical protein